MAGGINMISGRAFCFIALGVAVLGSAAAAQKDVSDMNHTVRNPAVAGQFYTADPAALKKEIRGYLDAAKPPALGDETIAIVSPHAGYPYSGQVAAYGYKLVAGRHYDAVVVISPSHAEYFSYSSVFPGAAYRTPLGDVHVDVDLAKLIVSKSELVQFDMRGHETRPFRQNEHALEVQLPFLQVALGDFKLVPIVMGDQSAPVVEALGKALGEALRGKHVLIVASTDLSHFHDDAKARSLDGEFQSTLALFDPAALLTALASNSVEACGGGPVVSAMIAARSLGATKCVVLTYANSGDVTGDRDRVVGYLSAAMAKGNGGSKPVSKSRASGATPPSPAGETASGSKQSKPTSGSELTRDDKVFLLALARGVIESECRGEKRAVKPSSSPIMREPRGAFVTLKKAGQLRGCIGYIEAVKPLAETIMEMAKAAAFSDWRFNPVQAEEIPNIEIEISVLSPLSEVRDPSTVVVGTHGLIVSRGSNRGVLLPQVPTEWGWDRETFLAQTCAKAGLPANAWKEKGTRIESFTADVFSEQELGLRK
jgi:AmmeMemoRadiSam system protein B/AmmeMemoRadiSam system protein A